MNGTQTLKYFIAFLLLGIFSCERKTLNENTEIGVPSDTETPSATSTIRKAKVKKANTVSRKSYLERKFLPESELFGKFFQDRIQFHIVEDPDLTLYKTKVKALTFYHIDDELSKKKFVMAGDISSDLVAVFGNFKLRPLDSVSVAVSKSQPIVKSDQNGKYLNRNLRNFEMRWEKSDKTIRFETKTDSLGAKSFIYSEENPDYKFMFQSIQNGIGIEALSEFKESP